MTIHICPTCEEAPRSLRGKIRTATLAEAIKENTALRSRISELEAFIRGRIVSSFGVTIDVLGAPDGKSMMIDVIRCECGATVEGMGRNKNLVTLGHRKGCPLRACDGPTIDKTATASADGKEGNV